MRAYRLSLLHGTAPLISLQRSRVIPKDYSLLSGFILSVFRWSSLVGWKNKERYGKYWTKRSVLEAYERLESLKH